MRWSWVVAAVFACGVAQADDRVAVDVEYEAGVQTASRAKVTPSFARSFWDRRTYAELRLGLGSTTGGLVIAEARAGLGLEFHPSERVDLRVGWRIGDVYFHGQLGGASYSNNQLGMELAVQLAVAVAPGWRLRVVPLAPNLYWRNTYGASVGFELGVEHAL